MTGDSDKALHFNRLISSAANAAAIYTNQLYVPRLSPLSTLNPPFSVEMWYYPTNTSSQTFWGQFSFEGINAGNEGHGDGNYAGMTLVYNGAFTVYGQNNAVQTTLVGSAAQPVNNWYHLVVTCDLNTNVSLYLNGNQVGSASAVGKFSPDYWSPMTIGGSRGGTRSCPGTIDEFAVYTNVINDIYTHYSDGISGGAGAYFHDVTNDNPIIYLRMDAPAYNAPALGGWPTLQNYGTTNGVAVGNGVYTPGTLPGVLTNLIANPNGVPFGGVSNTVAGLSGVSSFGDAGSVLAYNPTGSNANFAVTALFRGNPCDNRVQSIVGHGTNSWQLTVTTNGCLVFNAGNGHTASGGTGQAAGDIRTVRVYNDGLWHQVVAVNQTNVISIYVDGVLDTNGTPSGITPTNMIPGNTSDVMLGSDPS